MDIVIEKLENIDALLSVLDDEDKIKFDADANDDLVQINNIINELYSKIAMFKLSKEKSDQIKFQVKKEKIITKHLFSYYWVLNEFISNIKNDENGQKIMDDLENMHQINETLVNPSESHKVFTLLL